MRRTETPQVRIALLGLADSHSNFANQIADQLTQRGFSTYCVRAPLFSAAEPAPKSANPQHFAQRTESLLANLAAPQCDCVIADNTALSLAVLCDIDCNDNTLYATAIAHQRSYQITLLHGIESKRDESPLQAPLLANVERFDRRMRHVLQSSALPFQVLYGSTAQRLEHALNAINKIANNVYPQRISNIFSSQKSTWTLHCAHCGDADCEQRLFQALRR